MLCDFITGEHFGRYLRRKREAYAERLPVLLEGAREELAGLLEVSQIEAGQQIVGRLCEGIDGKNAPERPAPRRACVSELTTGRLRPSSLRVSALAR